MNQADADMVCLHSSTVAFQIGNDWRALVILGRSGAGKSELALSLIAMGARLVADDQTEFRRDGTMIFATAPPVLRGLIEMRGMGLLRADPVDAIVHALVDLDQRETDRMPPARTITLLGQTLPLLHRVDSSAFAAGLRQYMLGMANPALVQGGKDGND